MIACPSECSNPWKAGCSREMRLIEINSRLALDLYYDMHGWDRDGVPTPGKLVELGLGWINDLLGKE